MAISVTTLGTNSNTSGATVAIASLTIPSGALIFVGSGEGGTNLVGGTVADTPGNTYTQISFKNNNNIGSKGFGQTFYAKNAIALSSGTITFTKETSGDRAVISGVYATGIDTAAPLDTAVTNTATGSSTAPSVASAGTASQAGNLVIGFASGNNSVSNFTVNAGNGWSASPDQVASGTGSTDSQSIGGNQVNAGTGSNTFAVTGPNKEWAAFIAAFSPASGHPAVKRMGGVKHAARVNRTTTRIW